LSVKAGGLVGVCRNPVNLQYIKENAALGGITQAMELGEVLFNASEGPARVQAVANHLGGQVIHEGEVTEFALEKKGGFDVGIVQLEELELTFWNEYMTAEVHGKRLGTFPDLIMTFDVVTGLPVV